MKSTFSGRVLTCVVATFALVAARGEIVTNRWLNAQGGNWFDSANWSDPVMLGTNEATIAFFDLTALAPGETVSVAKVEDDSLVTVYGLCFGKADSLPTDAWTLKPADTFPNLWDGFLLTRKTPDGGHAKFDVRGGTLRIGNKIKRNNNTGQVVEKIGTGSVAFPKDGADSGVYWRIREGALVPTAEILRNARVSLASPAAELRLTNATTFVGGLAALNRDAQPVDLQGNELALTGADSLDPEAFDYPIVKGRGTVRVMDSVSLGLSQSQTNFTGTWKIGCGDIKMSNDILAYYDFEKPDNPGAAVFGPDLGAVGAPRVVTDATRGKVLYLDGSSHLSFGDGTTLPKGFVLGKQDAYTLSFWMKKETGCEATASVFYMGKWNTSGACLLLRLETEGRALYTNFSNNRTVAGEGVAAIHDGAWHHVAIRRKDSQWALWVDGAQVDKDSWNENVLQDGEFWIGYGQNGKHFKGWIDDFIYVRESRDCSAVNADELRPMLHPDNHIRAFVGGRFLLEGPQSVSALEGENGGSKLILNGPLSVTGHDGTKRTVFGGTIDGSGDLIKRGADYTLGLSGANAFTGRVEVAEGVLALSRGTNAYVGCIGNWRFEDGSTTGEFGLTLKAEGGVSIVDDEDTARGKVVAFDGTDGKLTLAAADLPGDFPLGNSDYTYSLWIKGATDGTANAGVIAWGQSVATRAVLWRLDGSTGWMMTNWDQNHNGVNKINFRDGAWHHVVSVREGSARRVYVDGAFLEQWTAQATTDLVTDKGFNLGWNPFGSTYFKGRMDDIRVYPYALTEAEAKAEYGGAVAAPRFVVRTPVAVPEPLYRWTFEDASAVGANTGSAADGMLEGVGNACSSVEGERPGRVLDLTGETMSYLSAQAFPASFPAAPGTNVTISMWAKVVKPTNSGAMFYCGDAAGFMLIGSYDSHFLPRVTIKDGGDSVSHGFTLAGTAARAWHHLVTVYDGSIVHSYVDGVPVRNGGAFKKDFVGNKGNFWIGRKLSSETDWFNGYLDDVEVYGAALTDRQVAELYRREDPRAGEPALGEGVSEVRVAEGAALAVGGDAETVAKVSGAGEVVMAAGSSLTARDLSGFAGTVTGAGAFGPADGATWDAAALPIAAVSGTVTIPPSGTLAFAGKKARAGTYVIATGENMAAPAGLAGWTVSPTLKGEPRFEISADGKSFVCTVPASGMVIIFR